MPEQGKLYLVATPIGNLEDITLRALRTLKEVDLIAAEDTRQSLKLLNHFEFSKPMTSYHEHNKIEKGKYLISQLMDGKSIALVSDAGSPGISDPGEDLVRLAIQSGIEVTMIPGPVAAITGLVISGQATGRFVFEGFLPMNKKFRKERILSVKNEIRTLIFYEAPHKLLNSLKDLYEILGDRNIALARELTKRYEQVIRCTLSQAIEKYSTESPKGEFVLIVEGANEKLIQENTIRQWDELSLEEHLIYYMEQGFDKKDAIKKVAADRDMSKRDVYNSLISK
ncbi:MAG: putative S-adenosylmethionine-dependent methyltransferase, YraL family [Clostridiales bacterium]|jgi:16S rRNA (cytidine1402-2'-O)-methyltransferase|nr:putative S-adenosylmethionine-dependent methyltransferase, YraL family [Clostridiales bacterium]